MDGKVVVITGGSSGIGKACAVVFGKKGAHVVITGRDIQKLNDVAKELAQENISFLTIQADVSIPTDSQKMIEKTLSAYGKIDILINNAGISMRAMFEDMELDVFRKVMDINFYGAVYCTKYALPHILATKGSIVAVSSIAGKRGLPARTGYSASKFAMEGFFESLRTELIKKGVHVLVACPGFTASNIRNAALAPDGTPQGESPRDESKMMTAEEVAAAIYKAVVNRRRDLILTTQGHLTTWLQKFFPSWMDKMVYKHLAKEKDSPLR